MATFQKVPVKGGKIRHRVIIRLKGNPPQSATFDRLTDARKWAQSIESAMRERRYFPGRETLKHTVADLLDRYSGETLEDFSATERRNRERQLKWWRQRLGHRLLADLTSAAISEALTALRRGGGPSG